MAHLGPSIWHVVTHLFEAWTRMWINLHQNKSPTNGCLIDSRAQRVIKFLQFSTKKCDVTFAPECVTMWQPIFLDPFQGGWHILSGSILFVFLLCTCDVVFVLKINHLHRRMWPKMPRSFQRFSLKNQLMWPLFSNASLTIKSHQFRHDDALQRKHTTSTID